MIFVLVGYVCVCALRRSMCEIFMQVKFEFTAVAIKGFCFTERFFFLPNEIKIMCAHCL